MDRSNAVIRRLSGADAVRWQWFRIAALEDTPEAFQQTLKEARAAPLDDWVRDLSGPSLIFGAFVADQLVGTVMFSLSASPKMTHRGQLGGVYVIPEFRRYGIGRLLVDAALAYAVQHVEQVHLCVVTDNVAAYDVYRRAGFQAYGIEPRGHKYNGRYYDGTMMVKFLRAGR